MKDILIDADFDLQIHGGDFGLADATHQNQGLILLANKGEFRQFPFVGVGLNQFVDDDRIGSIRTELLAQLELDGMQVNDISIFTDGRIEIDANYE